MGLKDYYQILNVSQDASAQDIKKSFWRLALQYHPDHNPENVREAGEKFKVISEAYEVLGDEQKKQQYDSLINILSYSKRTTVADSNLNDDIGSESVREILRRMADMGFIIKGAGMGKP